MHQNVLIQMEPSDFFPFENLILRKHITVVNTFLMGCSYFLINIIVNDGSSDDTSKIAHEYEEKYPTIIKAVDKENGGHGDAVNSGLTHATGKYFKVVDSDDWVDAEALRKILEFLKKLESEDEEVDMLISNYVYEKVGATHKKCIHYRNVLPQNKIFKWEEIGRFHLDQ